ncbi:MAG: hypothetical protein ABIR15_08565 [Chitinophagaceae bacterium]
MAKALPAVNINTCLVIDNNGLKQLLVGQNPVFIETKAVLPEKMRTTDIK